METNQELMVVPLGEEHLESLAQMEEKCFSMPWSLSSYRDLLKYTYCHYKVGIFQGKVVGIAGMVALGGEGDIDKVMVDPMYRHRGFAGRLLDAVFQEGDALGITAYTLEVRVGNVGAIRLYEKKGFVSQGVRPGFYDKPREDALIMWRTKEQ